MTKPDPKSIARDILEAQTKLTYWQYYEQQLNTFRQDHRWKLPRNLVWYILTSLVSPSPYALTTRRRLGNGTIIKAIMNPDIGKDSRPPLPDRGIHPLRHRHRSNRVL